MRPVRRAVAGLVLTTMLASRAAAQSAADASVAPDANVEQSALVPSSPPIAPAPPPGPAPLVAAPVAASPELVAPGASTSAVRSLDGPGDEEAKADFQQALLLPDGSPLRFTGRYGSIALYGFGQFDYLRDSTQSFRQAANNFELERRGTPLGNNSREQVTFCNSRIGLHLATSDDYVVGAALVGELGPSWEPGDDDRYFCGRRLRHLYFGFRSPIVDVLLGRYYSLFGWGGKGFFPNTAAFLGLPGQVYRLEPQVRLTHIFRTTPVDLELAAAFSGAPQYVSGAGEATLAVRLAVNGWRGASAQGSGPPVAAPLQLGIARVGRRFAVSAFSASPRPNIEANGAGWSVNMFAPIIPARGDYLGNALSVTLEATWGTGLSDMYTGLTGGARFPTLPNPSLESPAPVYRPNIAPAIVTFDANLELVTIDWKTLLVGAQYHLPFARGRRVWLSANYSCTQSNNLKILTPFPSWGGVFTEADYFDANAFFAPTRALQIALSYQSIHQSFADPVTATNRRWQVGVTYFF